MRKLLAALLLTAVILPAEAWAAPVDSVPRPREIMAAANSGLASIAASFGTFLHCQVFPFFGGAAEDCQPATPAESKPASPVVAEAPVATLQSAAPLSPATALTGAGREPSAVFAGITDSNIDRLLADLEDRLSLRIASVAASTSAPVIIKKTIYDRGRGGYSVPAPIPQSQIDGLQSQIGLLSAAMGNNGIFGNAQLVNPTADLLTVTGDVTANAFYGDGSHLTGISGGGSFSTSTTRSVFSSATPALSYASSTGAFALAGGYAIPLTASTTEWAAKVGSQWTTAGADIFYSTGGSVNVGIAGVILNADGSASFANGSATIDSSGQFTGIGSGLDLSANYGIFGGTLKQPSGYSFGITNYGVNFSPTDGNGRISSYDQLTDISNAGFQTGATLISPDGSASFGGGSGSISFGSDGSAYFGGGQMQISPTGHTNFNAGLSAPDIDSIDFLRSSGNGLHIRNNADLVTLAYLGEDGSALFADGLANIDPEGYAFFGNGNFNFNLSNPQISSDGSNGVNIYNLNAAGVDIHGHHWSINYDGSGNFGSLMNMNGAGELGLVGLIASGFIYTPSLSDTYAGNFQLSGPGGNSYVTANGGNFGIGTVTPQQKLTVAGTIQATNLLGGATSLSTDASGNIIRTPSDETLKEDIAPITGALDTVLQLKGVTYAWKDKTRFGDGQEIGLIAQQIEPIVPQVVKGGGEYKSVNYQSLVALLIEAIKELRQVVSDSTQWVVNGVGRLSDLWLSGALHIGEEVCADEVCVTKEQFKDLLRKAGGSAAVRPHSAGGGGDAATSTSTTTEVENATATTTSSADAAEDTILDNQTDAPAVPADLPAAPTGE